MTEITILTDAQIKASPTNLITVVPAPGAGKIIQPLAWMIVTNFPVSDYTNQAADVRIGIPRQGFSDLNSSSWSILDADAFGVFNAQGGLWYFAPPIGRDLSGGDFTMPNDDALDAINQPLQVKVLNGGNGAFTGGASENTMRFIIQYSIATVSA